MSNNRDLLKEAIADAKAVKETAIANAKAALEEAFTPHLKSMLAAKLEEMDKEDDDKMEESTEIQETEDVVNETEESVDEGYGKKDDKEKMDEAEEVAEAKEEIEESEEIEEELDLDEMLAELDLSEKKEEEGKDKMEESEELDEAKEEVSESEEIEESEEVEEAEEPVAEAEEDEDEKEDEEGEDEAEEGEEEEIDLEDMSADDLKGFIEDVIKDMVEAGELEGDLDAEGDEEIGDDLDMPMMEETEEVSESEEIEEAKEDLDEGIIDTLTKIFDKVTGIDKFAACQDKDWEGDECAKLKQEIGYAAGVKGGFEKGSGAVMEDDVVNALAEVEELKKELNEVNLLNAKLLYTNKIFRDKNLTEDKKVKVLKAFDKASTVKEAKVIFETLNEGLISKAKAPVNEVKGSASKVMGTAPTTKQPIVESNEMVERFKKLAGII